MSPVKKQTNKKTCTGSDYVAILFFLFCLPTGSPGVPGVDGSEGFQGPPGLKGMGGDGGGIERTGERGIETEMLSK